jgi:hypothetical protein
LRFRQIASAKKTTRVKFLNRSCMAALTEEMRNKKRLKGRLRISDALLKANLYIYNRTIDANFSSLSSISLK